MYLTNFIFNCTFFHIASYQIVKNGEILINRGSFFQEKDSLQFDRFQFLKINSLIAETIKNFISKQHFYKQIAELDNNSFIFRKLETVKL